MSTKKKIVILVCSIILLVQGIVGFSTLFSGDDDSCSQNCSDK